MTHPTNHAIVLGGSMAGLLAARVLADRFQCVTLIERDQLPSGPEQRKGVPQGQHLHALLSRGYQVMTGLFPDLREALIAEGALIADVSERMNWYHFGGYKLRETSGIEGVMVSRPLIESLVRQRVLALPNVTLRAAHDAVEVLTDGARATITGVVVRCRATQATERLAADLVIDATGRGSHTPQWLAALGYDVPPESEVKIGVGYTTRLYRRDPNQQEWNYVTPTAPVQTRLGGAFPIEGDRWIVTLGGYFGDHAPDDERGFLDYARSFDAPEIAQIVATATPLGDPLSARFPASRRRHYERLKRFPGGFVVVGDAVCSFNPIYGQGMTVCACEALALGAWLDGGKRDPRRFFGQIAKIVDVPWMLAVGEDFRYPQTSGPKPAGTDLINAYIARVHRATIHDPVICRAFMRVMHLLAPPASLFHPQIVVRALFGRRQPRRDEAVATNPAT
jgi:2-polyprenyl-6-methoxyphenol hydroxylase-like FAD-dependent oxidoreductase